MFAGWVHSAGREGLFGIWIKPGLILNAKLHELEALIEPIAQALGYTLVRVRLSGSHRPVLQVMAERADGSMPIEDCAKLSNAISTAFEQDDPIEGQYVLEVSSPGIDRPLTKRRDFEHYAGHEARLDLKYPIEGRKRFKGVLKGLRGEDLIIEVEAGEGQARREYSLPYTAVGDAKLVLTDALIEQDLKRKKSAG